MRLTPKTKYNDHETKKKCPALGIKLVITIIIIRINLSNVLFWKIKEKKDYGLHGIRGQGVMIKGP